MSGPAIILRIDVAGQTPAYRQLVDQLRALLVSESFKPGDQLPTVRQVAADLGIHHNTVAEAYRQLAEEGWLELRRRRGARVLDRPLPRSQPRHQKALAQRIREVLAEAIAAGVSGREAAEILRAAAEGLQDDEGGAL